LKLVDLISGMKIIHIKGDTNIEIRGITKDSREVKEGFIFFATNKSSAYIEDAKKRGAKVIVSDRELDGVFPCSIITENVGVFLGEIASKFYGFPSKNLYVIGITGTNGKTTTSYLIESILKNAGRKVGLIGTISYRYNGHTLKAENTTPGAVEIHGLLRDMYASRVEFVVMEVSSHALDQQRVEGIEFDTGIFTNLTHDHLDYHGDFESYKKAKKLFFDHYLKESKKERKYSILNLDDPVTREFIPGAPIKTFFYSLRDKTDAYISNYNENMNGLKLELSVMGKKISIQSPLVGIFNASNILASCLFGYVVNIPYEEIKKGVEGLEGVPGRVERIGNEKGIYIFVDYAHTPDALNKVLEMLNRLKRGRLILIFGCGGNRDTAKRPIMGNIASRLADFAIITSDNPRNEDPKRIIEDIKKGFNGNTFKTIENRKEAIDEGIKMARENDVLLVAGKGHEDYQIIGDKICHFSDREVIEESLNVVRG
jgi:UDP-N-acetylmuramoyl-L-alanyl-D-glutamate--2,6-diaminopimelate ligase